MDSAILVRERTRGSKLDGVFQEEVWQSRGRVEAYDKMDAGRKERKWYVLSKKEVAVDRSGDGQGGSRICRMFAQSERWPDESSSDDEEVDVTGRSDESRECRRRWKHGETRRSGGDARKWQKGMCRQKLKKWQNRTESAVKAEVKKSKRGTKRERKAVRRRPVRSSDRKRNPPKLFGEGVMIARVEKPSQKLRSGKRM